MRHETNTAKSVSFVSLCFGRFFILFNFIFIFVISQRSLLISDFYDYNKFINFD